MTRKSSAASVLKKIDGIERELAKLKRDIIHSLVIKESANKAKQSLFGSIKGGDITEKMIEQSQRNLFRNLKDL
jgi:ribosomal protein L9